MNNNIQIMRGRFYLHDYILGRIHTAYLDNLLFETKRFLNEGTDGKSYLENSLDSYIKDSNRNTIKQDKMLTSDNKGDVSRVNGVSFYSHSLTSNLDTLSEHLKEFIDNKHSTIIEGFDHMDWRFDYYLTRYSDKGELVIEKRIEEINFRWVDNKAEVNTYILSKKVLKATTDNIRRATHLNPERV